jgi:hypothetical protein
VWALSNACDEQKLHGTLPYSTTQRGKAWHSTQQACSEHSSLLGHSLSPIRDLSQLGFQLLLLSAGRLLLLLLLLSVALLLLLSAPLLLSAGTLSLLLLLLLLLPSAAAGAAGGC